MSKPDRDQEIATHYTHGSLMEAIKRGLSATGVAPGAVTIDDLSPVDELHIGGREASEAFLPQLGLESHHHVLDIGSGLGGVARYAAARFGCKVTGIDLTPEFVDTANALSDSVHLGGQVGFRQASALELPFQDGAFDAAYVIHVGMNIADKARLFVEAARVLKPGAAFGIFDIMAMNEEPLAFPVPWAASADTSAVEGPEAYKAALRRAGFEITAERNRLDLALDFFEKTLARMEEAGGLPPLGTHIVLGPTFPELMVNTRANIEAGRMAPVEIIARRLEA